jgi:phosphate starvation-inducible PhoH-like protein
MAECSVAVGSMEDVIALFGNYDENAELLQKQFGVALLCRGNDLRISGERENVAKAKNAVDALLGLIERGEPVTEQNIRYVCSVTDGDGDVRLDEIAKLADGALCATTNGRAVKPKTVGQKRYADAISKSTVTMGIGPAGTGKTYLAVAKAVSAFKAREVSRIILTRPAVEAGEKLGFLPGDLQSKIDPYLRPLYDALFDMLGSENFQRQVEKGTIEVAPLAYMRGRTLDDSFIILDEAQNATREQFLMFLTRLGFNSKMVINGDITQIDLPPPKKSGLTDAAKILKNIEGVSIVRLSEKDVVRHKLVQDIIKAYENI